MVNKEQAIEIALTQIKPGALHGEVRAGFVDGQQLLLHRRQVIQVCNESGVFDSQQIESILEEQGLSGPYWVVAIFPPSTSGSVTSAHAIIIRVDAETGVAHR